MLWCLTNTSQRIITLRLKNVTLQHSPKIMHFFLHPQEEVLLAVACGLLELESWKPQELLCGRMFEPQELLCSSLRDTLKEWGGESVKWSERHSRVSAKNMVIVKKSSPNNLSADCRSTVGRQSADCWSLVGRQLADCRPFVGRQTADSRPTGFARNIGYLGMAHVWLGKPWPPV